MALISLLESKNADTNFFFKLIEYWIYKTYARLNLGFLSSLSASTAFSLATITGIEVVKTITNLCLLFLHLRTLVSIMALFPIIEVLNLKGVSFFFLESDVYFCCKSVLALSPLLSMPRTSFEVLVFFWVSGKSLMSRR